MRTYFSLALAMVMLVLGACAAVQPGRSMGREIDDFNASTRLKASMLRAEGYALNGVGVEITEGVVLLSGHAPRPEDRIYAECLAWSVHSVRQVSNQIEVGGRRGFVQASRDAWITQQLRARLASDRNVRSLNFNIETRSGVVHLLGYARSPEERDRAATHASLIEGVKRVIVLARASGDGLDLPARGARQADACSRVAQEPDSGKSQN